MERTHDQLYLNENRYDNVKENFKFCRSFVPAHDGRISIYDFGCAAGEQAHYLVRQFPHDQVVGIDVLPELVDKARRSVPEAEFRVASVLNPAAVASDSADVSLMVGVHTIFDSPTDCFANVISWTKPGGRAIIFGLFNPDPLDVFIQVRGADMPSDRREVGWNMISQATVSKFLLTHPKVKSHQFHPFQIGIDLPKQDDPLRSWTELLADGSRQVINGLGLVHRFYALVVDIA